MIMERKPSPLELCLLEACRLSTSSLSAEIRLGVILADNAVELLLLGMAEEFIFHDRWSTKPSWDYDRRVQVHSTFEAKSSLPLSKAGSIRRKPRSPAPATTSEMEPTTLANRAAVIEWLRLGVRTCFNLHYNSRRITETLS